MAKYNRDMYGDNSSPISKPLGNRAMKQLDKSDMTADINGVADSRVRTEVDGDEGNSGQAS